MDFVPIGAVQVETGDGNRGSVSVPSGANGFYVEAESDDTWISFQSDDTEEFQIYSDLQFHKNLFFIDPLQTPTIYYTTDNGQAVRFQWFKFRTKRNLYPESFVPMSEVQVIDAPASSWGTVSSIDLSSVPNADGVLFMTEEVGGFWNVDLVDPINGIADGFRFGNGTEMTLIPLDVKQNDTIYYLLHTSSDSLRYVPIKFMYPTMYSVIQADSVTVDASESNPDTFTFSVPDGANGFAAYGIAGGRSYFYSFTEEVTDSDKGFEMMLLSDASFDLRRSIHFFDPVQVPNLYVRVESTVGGEFRIIWFNCKSHRGV